MCFLLPGPCPGCESQGLSKKPGDPASTCVADASPYPRRFIPFRNLGFGANWEKAWTHCWAWPLPGWGVGATGDICLACPQVLSGLSRWLICHISHRGFLKHRPEHVASLLIENSIPSRDMAGLLPSVPTAQYMRAPEGFGRWLCLVQWDGALSRAVLRASSSQMLPQHVLSWGPSKYPPAGSLWAAVAAALPSPLGTQSGFPARK